MTIASSNIPKPEKNALIVFTKRPQLGQGKQRLATEIGSETAYKVAGLLLKQTLATLDEWDGPLIISPSSQDDSQWASKLLKRPVIVIPQYAGGLGERLEKIDREVRMLGLTELIYIGTDAPLLSVANLNNARQSLANYDQVFIPANDGGVVLMASCVPWKNLATVDWSTEKVFMQLKSLAVRSGLSVQILSEQIDLDDISSFSKLKPHLIKSGNTSETKYLQEIHKTLKNYE